MRVLKSMLKYLFTVGQILQEEQSSILLGTGTVAGVFGIAILLHSPKKVFFLPL